MSFEKHLNTDCGRATIEGSRELQDILKSLEREGRVEGTIPKDGSKTSTWTDLAFEVYVNALLSSPKTQVVNIVSNFVPVTTRPLETLLAAGWSQIERAFRGDVDITTAKEAFTEAASFGEASMEAVKFLKTRLKSTTMAPGKRVSNEEILEQMGIDPKLAIQSKIERQRRIINGDNTNNRFLATGLDWAGAIINFPGQSLSSFDTAFKIMNYRMQISKDAMHKAINSGARTADEINSVFRNTKQEILDGTDVIGRDRAVADADARTYTKRPEGRWGKAFAEKGHDFPGVRWITPFRRTMVNLIDYGIERTPVAWALRSSTREALKGTPAQRAEAIGRMALGSIILSTFYYTTGDKVDGKAPYDYRERELWETNGHKQWTLHVGDKKIPLDFFGGFGTMMKAITSARQLWSNIDYEEDDPGAVEQAMAISEVILLGLADTLVDEYWASNLLEFTDALSDALQNNDADPLMWYAARVGGGFVPNVVYQGLPGLPGTKDIDPIKRQVTKPWEVILARVPEISKNLPPKIDFWGDVMTHDNWITPEFSNRITGQDEVANELLRIGYSPMKETRTQLGVRLDPWEFVEYQRVIGKGGGVGNLPPLREAIIDVLKSKRYQEPPKGINEKRYDEWRKKLISKVVQVHRSNARATLQDDPRFAGFKERVDKYREFTRGTR